MTEQLDRTTLYGDGETVRRVLQDSSLWFVVGLGQDPTRAAFDVARVLQEHGKRIVPIHPRAETVLGEVGYPSIAAAAGVHGAPDVVDVFVNSAAAGRIADQAVAAGAGAVWFQIGVIDEAAAGRVVAAGADMVMNRCPKIEWSR